MSTLTTRLALIKPASSDTALISQLNTNADVLDASCSATLCTSSTRPSTPFGGQTIFETDTNLMYVWNGTLWKIAGGSSSTGAYTICTSGTRPGSPTDGTLIYETDTKLNYVWNATDWILVPNIDKIGRGIITNVLYANAAASPSTTTNVNASSAQPIVVEQPAGAAITVSASVPVIAGRKYMIELDGAFRANAATGVIALNWSVQRPSLAEVIQTGSKGPYTLSAGQVGTSCYRRWIYTAVANETVTIRPKHHYFTTGFVAQNGWAQEVALTITDIGLI